jgi:CRISPR/Cas system-associated exonuclease Cas4 (RecB family)
MNIKRDLSSLPTVDPKPEERQLGVPPTRQPTIGPKLAQAWFEARTHDDDLPRAVPEAGPFRGSDAGKCNRQLWYRLQGTEKTEPTTIADHWRMDLGTMVHEALQDVIASITPGALNELKLDLNGIGIPGSMHVDILNPVDTVLDEKGQEYRVYEAVEIKTVNGFGYKMMATTYRKAGPEGPRESHAMQAALGAAAAEAEGYKVKGARIVYLSMELVGPELAENIGLGGEEARFTAEWFIPIDECRQIAAREAQRLQSVLEMHETNEPWVMGFIPTSAFEVKTLQVVNPKTGAGVFTHDQSGGKTWMCNYCSYQSQCIRDYSDRITLASEARKEHDV